MTKENSQRKIGKGTVIFLVFGLLFIVFWAALKQPASGPATATPRTTIHKDQWYQGGTLHKSTAAEWNGADFSNRLATSADFVASIWQNAGRSFSSMEEMKDKATAVQTYISEAASTEEAANLAVAELAASCAILMGYK